MRIVASIGIHGFRALSLRAAVGWIEWDSEGNASLG